VAQRFSAEITALFCIAALAAEVKMCVAREFFRSLFSCGSLAPNRFEL
jgi:hypothetical protein